MLADTSTLEEGTTAEEAGADLVATTLVDCISYTKMNNKVDFTFIQNLLRELYVPVVVEGKIWTPEQAKRALDMGAYAVVVGSAITRPQEITKRFIDFIKRRAYGK